MAGPNSGGNTGEGFEANENSAPKQENMYSKLVKSYVSKKLNSKKERLAFAKKIESDESVPDDIIAELEAHKGTSGDFAGLEVKKENISLSTLQSELGSFLAGIESQKSTLRSTFLQEYDIDPSEYTQKIASKVDGINSEEELQQLQDSDTLRDEFLANIYKKRVPKRRLVSQILQDLNIEDRYDQLEDHLKVSFMSVVSKLQKRENLEVSDIMVLFESDILTTAEKAKILETFMPSISLADAKELGIIDTRGANAIKKKALHDALNTGLLQSVNVDNYLSGIQDSQLVISTHGIFKNKQSQEKLFEQNFFFEKFKDDFDAMFKKIEDDLAKQSIQTAGEMQEILSGVSHISGIENFEAGSTIVIKQNQKDKSGEDKEISLYAEIKSLASAGTFIIEERGMDKYDTNQRKSTRFTYSKFIDYVTKGNIPTSVEIITPTTLKHKIQTGEIKDANGNGKFEDKFEITRERDDLTQKISDRKEELRKKKIPKSEWNDDEILQELLRIQEEKNDVLDNIDEKNIKTLTAAIDELDAAGKGYGLDAGTSFVTNDGKGDVFTVQSYNKANQTITIRGLEKDEHISYVDFIEAFKQQKTTRVSKISTFEDLFSGSDDTYKKWSDFELKNGKIRNKKSKLKVDYDYLVPPAGGVSEMIKIHDIDGGRVTISFGEVKDKKKLDRKEKKEKKVGEIFATERKQYTLDVGVLDHYIRKNKLQFRSLEEGKVKEEEINSVPKPDSKFGIGNWFFQGMSMAAAMKGGKTAIEQIGQMWSEGDDVKANEFAFKVFGPLLGKDGKTEFQTRIEETQKKSMDEFISKLKGINSKPATALIKSWLLDPRTPEHKKEAGMFFMFEKYGALCAKELYEYQGQFFWYQKMGGRIGDDVWVSIHEKNEKNGVNTTEEELVYFLMKRQTRAGGFNGIQRRSKLDKELKAMRGKGKAEEYETGQKDGGNERDVKERIEGGLSEMSSGNYPNALGWLETVTDKGGTMEEMNKIPFVMMFSGMAYGFEKDLLDKVKNFPAESRMLMMLRFISYSGDIDLVNDTIMEACARLDNDPKYSGILKEAQAIFNNQKDRTVPEPKKQKDTIKFYDKYGEVLTNILYMLNTGKEDDVHNKMIFFEKDSCTTFQKYYAKMEGYVNADGDFGKNEGLMADAFAQAGTSGIDIYRATKQMLELRTGGAWAKHESGPIMWKEIMHEFETIPNRKYDPDPVKNRQMQKKLLDSNLRKFLAAIVSLNTDTRVSSSYNAPTGFFNRLNDWGVYFDDLIAEGANAEAIKSGGHSELIDKFVDGIISFSEGGASKKRPTKSDGKGGFEYIKPGEETNTITVSDLIQGKTQKIIQGSGTPANDNKAPDEE